MHGLSHWKHDCCQTQLQRGANAIKMRPVKLKSNSALACKSKQKLCSIPSRKSGMSACFFFSLPIAIRFGSAGLSSCPRAASLCMTCGDLVAMVPGRWAPLSSAA